jgi:Spy/CpxP family protein refolding chaperone
MKSFLLSSPIWCSAAVVSLVHLSGQQPTPAPVRGLVDGVLVSQAPPRNIPNESYRPSRRPGGAPDSRPEGRPPAMVPNGPPPGISDARDSALRFPPGRWWTDPQMIQNLSLTPDQQSKFDETFQQYRTRLIDARASVEKEEANLEPLVEAAKLDEAKVSAQLEKVVLARADWQRTSGRMLVAFRAILSGEQWKQLRLWRPDRNRGFEPRESAPRLIKPPHPHDDGRLEDE